MDYSSDEETSRVQEEEGGEKEERRRMRKEIKAGTGEQKILCRICGDGAVRHVHYGGHCCFSCKAFFRRAVNWQNKNNRTFQCKFESGCEINIKNRKTCQSCRFQKCITTGMNPSWVLSDDQRKKRFKKYRETGELSPTSSQDSSREGELDLPLERDSGRRRAKSAPSHAHRQASRFNHDDLSLPASQPVSPLERDYGACRIARCSRELDIKTEPSLLSPLREDSFPFGFDPLDHVPIKEEPEMELDDLNNLQTLISTCDFVTLEEEKKKTEGKPPDFSQYKPPDFPGCKIPEFPDYKPDRSLKVELGQEEMLSLMKLEMSFENSSSSFPVMSAETASIWNSVLLSCNFDTLNNRLTNGLLSEAVELCLRRNLIFLQENLDFTSLSVETRKLLYIKNMVSMCHVRGLMLRSSSAQNFTCISNSNLVQISYKNMRTGEIKLWNLMEEEEEEGQGIKEGATETTSSLLHLAEEIWKLKLERGTFLILLLVVLFSSQGCNLQSCFMVDRFQNKYLALLYRYLQGQHGQETAQKHLTIIMKFVLALLTNSY